tara:strand:- start:2692 stop:3408 length:717 start_codon:yes stop_codon:yes gene_type:complete
MAAKVIIVGSGDSSQINSDLFNKIYASNISFKRLSCSKKAIYVFSEALLYTEDDLSNAQPFEGLSIEESNRIRLEKYNQINNLKAKKIYVVCNDSAKTLSALKRKNIEFESLEIISNKMLWNLYRNTFNSYELITIFFRLPSVKLKFAFLVQFALKRKMSVFFRPSTGITSIMIALKEAPNFKTYSNGINVSKQGTRTAFWGGDSVQYNNYSHGMDYLYYKFFELKGLINLTEESDES